MHAYGKMPSSFEVYQSGLLEHLQALLGVDGSVKSGDPLFDKRFATNGDGRDPAGRLKIAEIQQIITALTPFVYLKVHFGGAGLSRDVCKPEDLDFEALDSIALKLVRFAEIGIRR